MSFLKSVLQFIQCSLFLISFVVHWRVSDSDPYESDICVHDDSNTCRRKYILQITYTYLHTHRVTWGKLISVLFSKPH